MQKADFFIGVSGVLGGNYNAKKRKSSRIWRFLIQCSKIIKSYHRMACAIKGPSASPAVGRGPSTRPDCSKPHPT